MRVVAAFEWVEREKCVAISRCWGEPLYVRVGDGYGTYVLARALIADGWAERSEIDALLGAHTIPEAAARAPRSWMRLMFLAGFCQEKAPARVMFTPTPNLAASAIASLAPYADKLESVVVEADGADLQMLVVAGELAGLKELALVYRSAPKEHVHDEALLSKREAAIAHLRSLNLLHTRAGTLVLGSLVGEKLRYASFHNSGNRPRPVYRARNIDLLEIVFGEKAGAAYSVLQELRENGGVADERSFREWLSSTGKLSEEDYVRLLCFGYVRRVTAPGAVATVLTEKGMYALVVSHEEQEERREETG